MPKESRRSGTADWRAAYPPPLLLTAVIVALAQGSDPKLAPDPAAGAGIAADAEASTAPA